MLLSLLENFRNISARGRTLGSLSTLGNITETTYGSILIKNTVIVTPNTEIILINSTFQDCWIKPDDDLPSQNVAFIKITSVFGAVQ